MQESEDQEAIRNVMAEWMAAHKRGDTQALIDLMADDMVFMRTGCQPMNKAAFLAASAVFVESQLKFDGVSDIKEICVHGAMAYSLSHLTVTTTRAGAIWDRRSFNTLTVFRKINGRWRFARDANVLAET